MLLLPLLRAQKLLFQCHITFISSARCIQTCKADMTAFFTGKEDNYKGVTVVSKEEPCNDEPFPDVLARSLQKWTELNKHGVWFKVDLSQADWVPTLAKNGFVYHHAKGDYVMMYKWLPSQIQCNIPPFAHTTIGVGAVVVNSEKQVLVVSERHITRPHWKLPGGYVEPGENLVDAAMREVFEETNISTEFRSLISVRHAHNGQFGCSDMYVVVSLRPKSTDVRPSETEISDCRWMAIEEYLEHPHIHELNKSFLHKYLEYERDGVEIECRHGIHQVMKKPYTVYSAVVKK